jgi:hypothetical protein
MALRSKIIPLFALSFVAAACSAPAAETGLAEGAQHTAAGVCATLDYGHTTTPEQFYRKFDTSEAAADYLTKIIAQGQLAAQSGADATLKEMSTDARLLGLVSEVFEGFKKAFPVETAGMTDPPRVAIVKTDPKNVNAYALGTGFAEDAAAPKDKAPWLFIIHTALLDHKNTDNEMRGLFAHELGHLILRTFLPEIRAHVRADYVIGKSGEDGILGADQDNDPHVQGHVEDIMKRQSRVGGLADLGFPVFESLATYPKVFGLLVKQAEQNAATADPTQVCKAAKDKLTEVQDAQKAFVPGVALGDFTPRTPTADEKANLDRLSDELADAYRSCLAPVTGDFMKTSLLELTASLNNMESAIALSSPDHQKLLDLMLQAELDVDAAMPSGTLVDRLLAAQSTIRKEYIALRDDPAFPIDQIRIFDFEEDADDAAARVLTTLGDDPMGIGDFLVTILPADAQAQCLADVNAHKPIPYGRFIDTHPSTCWRYYHDTQFAKGLSQCTAPATGRTTRAGGGQPSVADKAPNQMPERGYGRGLE